MYTSILKQLLQNKAVASILMKNEIIAQMVSNISGADLSLIETTIKYSLKELLPDVKNCSALHSRVTISINKVDEQHLVKNIRFDATELICGASLDSSEAEIKAIDQLLELIQASKDLLRGWLPTVFAEAAQSYVVTR